RHLDALALALVAAPVTVSADLLSHFRKAPAGAASAAGTWRPPAAPAGGPTRPRDAAAGGAGMEKAGGPSRVDRAPPAFVHYPGFPAPGPVPAVSRARSTAPPGPGPAPPRRCGGSGRRAAPAS